MKYEMIELRKGGFELDFIKAQDENHYTCATNFANKCGMDWKYINRLINADELLKDVSQKFGIRDQKNKPQNMVFIHSDHFLYFLSLIKGVKATNCPPNFVRNLILLYPMFLKELSKRIYVLHERMEENRISQLRINRMEKLKNYCISETKRLVNEIKFRNIEEVVYDIIPMGVHNQPWNWMIVFSELLLTLKQSKRMINLLKAISKDVNAHLWMIEAMGLNPLHLQRPESHQDMMFKSIGRTYLMKRRLEISISNLESIHKYCLSEINGTFYDDYEKRYEQFEGSEIAPEYTSDTPYEYILRVWDNHPSPEIDLETKVFIECSASLNTEMIFSILKFCPEAGPYQKDENGEMVKSNLSDCQIDDSIKAGSMLAAVEEYNERLRKIQEIAKNRGNLGEILTLIGDK